MATINPFQGPINYSVDVQSPFEAALGGFKLGAGVSEIQAAQQKRNLEQQALERAQTAQTELQNLFKNPNATSADYARVTAFLPKDQAAIVMQGFEAQTKEQQQNTLKLGTQVYTAIKSGNLPVAEMQLKEQAEALRNVGKEKEAQGYDDLSNLIRLNPTGAQTTIALTIAGLPGGKDFLDNADKTLSTMRAEALAPEALRKAKADADEAVQKAANAVATAPDDVAKAAAQRKLEEEKAKQEKIKTDIAEATQADEQARIIAVAEKARSDADKAVADAGKAVADAEKAVAEAKDTPSRLIAEKQKREADAKKAEADAKKSEAEAKYINQQQQAELDKKAADLGLTKAQKNKVLVETSNLNLTGKLLKLDFDAAVKGVPLPSGKGGTVGTATEDERKAAGWLVQADNAYKNMLNAMYTKEGKRTGAQEVGFFEAVGLGKVSQSPERQKFNQASASLAEALLRAATGAGQNEAEVKQKIEELTPTYFDTQENINQKLAAIPVYLDSLKARAGRAAPAGYVTPTKESVIATKPFSVTVGGKAFNFPTQQALDVFMNSDLYKKAAGNK
jgi:hypothetical protein